MTMAMMKTESPLARQTEAASCSQSQCGLLETEFFSYCASVLKQMCPKTRWDARDFFFVCVFTTLSSPHMAVSVLKLGGPCYTQIASPCRVQESI